MMLLFVILHICFKSTFLNCSIRSSAASREYVVLLVVCSQRIAINEPRAHLKLTFVPSLISDKKNAFEI